MSDQISYAEACREAAAKDENVADQLMSIDEPGSAREYLQSAAALRSLAALIERAEQMDRRFVVGIAAEVLDSLAVGFTPPAPQEG